MRREAVLIRHGAPLLIAVGGAEIRDHDGDGVAVARAVALTLSGDGAHIGQLIAGPASAAAPAARAAEQILAARRGEET